MNVWRPLNRGGLEPKGFLAEEPGHVQAHPIYFRKYQTLLEARLEACRGIGVLLLEHSPQLIFRFGLSPHSLQDFFQSEHLPLQILSDLCKRQLAPQSCWLDSDFTFKRMFMDSDVNLLVSFLMKCYS